MPDKDYIKNVYDNLNTAYGANGVVQKGSFNRSFEDFSNQMQDSNYAKNIYHNLDVAYGKDGVVQKGAFNRSFEDFYGNVKKKETATSTGLFGGLQKGLEATPSQSKAPLKSEEIDVPTARELARQTSVTSGDIAPFQLRQQKSLAEKQVNNSLS